MYGTQNKKGDDLQNAFPGCIGMMINVIDMSAGLPKFLTEQQLRDDQPGMLRKKTTDKFGVSKDDQAGYFRKYSSYKSTGTPMKMLIEHEMSREPQPDQNSSNVVAKLMGLDVMPKQLSTTKSKNSSHENLQSFMKCKIVNEVWHKPPQNRLQYDSSVEKRMALVRQKFSEAKNLATNENLLHSSKFEDAIDVLSSNRDLFLKFFEEPNAIFSKQSYEAQNKHLSSQTRRITVLKPSQTMEVKENSQRREFFVPNDIHQNTEAVNNPVRIVVLKPSLGMSHEMKAPVVSSELEHNEAKESREIARKITRKMQEYVSNREECSSKEDCDYTSDLESLTPTSRFGSPVSISSYSCASLHSSGSSVIKEAKKRLSERLSMVAFNEVNQDHSQITRSTCTTLGEMLSFGEGKREEVNEDSPRELLRSKSVPISRSASELTGSRKEVDKEVAAKSKSGISSFRETVSTLFSSRRKNKMDCSKKADPSLEATLSIHHSDSIEHVPVDHEQKHRKASSTSISMTSTSIEKCHFTDSQDQPSPSSILEAPFEDYLNNKISLPSTGISLCHPQALSRSPPIGSISRTLSCDNIHRKPVARVLPKECIEQERLALVQNLLSHANLSHNKDSTTILDKWHSLSSPLDPMLLHEFLDRKEEEEAKCRERRSNQRLTFDCVNAALLSIAHTTLFRNYPFVPQANCKNSFSINEEVWRILNEWISCENVEQHMLVEKFIKQEITGIGWVELMSGEVDEFSREIVEMVLEELVEDTLADVVGACL